MKSIVEKIARFLMVGGVGFTVDVATYHLIHGIGLPPEIARLASLGWATVVTWLLNRRFTFGASHRHAAEEGVRYVSVAIVAQGGNYLLFLAVIDLLPALPHIAAIGFSAAMAAAFSFTGHLFFSFAPRVQALRKKDSFNATI